MCTFRLQYETVDDMWTDNFFSRKVIILRLLHFDFSDKVVKVIRFIDFILVRLTHIEVTRLFQILF